MSNRLEELKNWASQLRGKESELNMKLENLQHEQNVINMKLDIIEKAKNKLNGDFSKLLEERLVKINEEKTIITSQIRDLSHLRFYVEIEIGE